MMTIDTDYAIARELVWVVHNGQFRRDGITPYGTHPVAVADRVSFRAKPAGFMHDGMEDNKWVTESFLRLIFTKETVDAIILLTKVEREDYFVYINRLAQNDIAREVKIADIEHNLSAQPNPKSIEKYKKALEILKNYVKH